MTFLVDPPVMLSDVASIGLTTDGEIVLQTGSDSTGPLASFVFGTDGTINGQALGGSTTPTTPVIDDTGWQNATLIGTWQNYGNTALQTMAPASVRKIGKHVQLRGIVKNTGATGSITGNIFKLPAGFVPGRQMQFMVSSQDKAVSLKIQTDGWVYVIAADPNWVSLDSVSFLID